MEHAFRADRGVREMWKAGKLRQDDLLEASRTPETRQPPAAGDGSSPRKGMRNYGVSSVPSGVAGLRKRALSTELPRIEVPRSVALAYPQKSPKDTLQGVFEKMKRTARAKKSMRMAERFAARNSPVQRLRQDGSDVFLG